MTQHVTSQSRDSAADIVRVADDVALDFVLVDELEDVRRVDEDGRGAGDGHGEEDAQLQSINHHRDVPPVIQYLHTHARTQLPINGSLIHHLLHALQCRSEFSPQ